MIDFFLKPWVGPVIAGIGLVVSIIDQTGAINTRLGDTLLIIGVAAAIGSYFTHREE
ncbi:MAG TPA: hypothetical protein PLB36_01135 [Bacillota bacterium]|nr:hypothetical protein [Candidatus Fermentithermobacillaceae bacterium]HOB29971.1 hypothetical protein [Bacillota bacterium]HOK63842.1 hypothetical protein [Bacillota bacterium]HOL11470.1 hypothetical protein [Bacillota bacterium]HOQ03200.1 hypothetical protein [Bacillota bacterium]